MDLMDMAQDRSENGVIRVIQSLAEVEKDHVGMGVLLTPSHILTCAHVVNSALGRDEYEGSAPDPDVPITVSFPILEDAKQMQALILDWSAPGMAGLDCAVLELSEPAPVSVGISILSIASEYDLLDDKISIYGSLVPGHPGAHVTAEVQGLVGAQWSQLTVNSPSGMQLGFSGSGVWARDQRATIGMAIALQEGTEGTVGYFLSAARIAERFGDLIPVEIRKVSLRRQRSFSMVSVILFFLLLVHFLASGGSATSGLVPWADDSKRLAAFFGAHFFSIFLGPYVMWHALRHARSFGLRRWWMRVPAFTFSRRADMLDNTPLGSCAVVLFLLLLPALCQIHLLRETFLEGHKIYANVERLEVKHAPEVIACNSDDPKWCTHDSVGTWAFLPRSPYFDHAYQYGDPCDDTTRCKMVTYFPTLQPLVLLGGTALGLMWFVMFLYALFRPWPYSHKLRIGKHDE